jgi:hypothetical protein
MWQCDWCKLGFQTWEDAEEHKKKEGAMHGPFILLPNVAHLVEYYTYSDGGDQVHKFFAETYEEKENVVMGLKSVAHITRIKVDGVAVYKKERKC